MKKFFLAIALVFTLLLSSFVMTVVSAETEIEEIPDIADVVPSETKTKTLRFYMPEQWRCEDNPFCDGENLSSCRAGIYWWEGSFSCASWPGYSISETEQDDSNIFVASVPDDVDAVVFNNLLPSDNDSREVTVNIPLDGYYADDNEFYPDGLDSVDNMIFIPVRNNDVAVLNNPYLGSWFYYYDDGRYGAYKTLSEAEANGAVYSGGEYPEIKKKPISIAEFTVSGIKNKTYTGKAITQSVVVKNGSEILKNGTDYNIAYKNNKNVGIAAITIRGKGNYAGAITKSFKIVKAINPMTLKTKTIKASSKKNTTFAKADAFTIKNAKGAVTFKRVSGDNKITITKSGKITVKKGLKKGKTYSVLVKAAAKGSSNYKSGSKTVTVKIKIK